MSRARFVGVELGGTKAIAVLSDGVSLLESHTLATTTPDETLGALRARIDQWRGEHPIAALGIASFGPVQLDRAKAEYGSILATPKPGWSGAQVAAVLTSGLEFPWAIDTDVNGAALAERLWGAGQGCDVVSYVTIGTGVGGGLLAGGQAVHGAMHPEVGHLRLRRAPGDAFEGACPFHGDCIEGLVSGPALAARFGRNAAEVCDQEAQWDHVAHDIAELCGAILLSVAAQRILFGGSVALSRPWLLDAARSRLVDNLGSYLPYLTHQTVNEIVRPAGLGDQAGPLGSVALALQALPAADQ